MKLSAKTQGAVIILTLILAVIINAVKEPERSPRHDQVKTIKVLPEVEKISVTVLTPPFMPHGVLEEEIVKID